MFFHADLDGIFVECDATLATEESGQIDGEAKSVVEFKGFFRREYFGSFSDAFKELHAAVERLIEALFLGGQCVLDSGSAGLDLGEDATELCDECIHKLGQKRLAAVEA